MIYQISQVSPIADIENYLQTSFNDPLTPREARQADAIRLLIVGAAELALALAPLGTLAKVGRYAAPLAVAAVLELAKAAADFAFKISVVIDSFGQQQITGSAIAQVNEALEIAKTPLTTTIVEIEKELFENGGSEGSYRALSELVEKIMEFQRTMDDKNSTALERVEAFKAVEKAIQKLVESMSKDAREGRLREPRERASLDAAIDRREHQERMRDIQGAKDTMRA